jgi:5-methylcytosine-specific restriction endonuclease McrA
MNKEIRAKRIEFAKGLCEICKKPAVTVHHIFLGRKQRNTSERIETVRAVCAECHAYIHGSKGYELLKWLQVQACNELIENIGEDETRKILGKIYF